MKHFLIPTDFSVNSWRALEYAIHLFNEESCTFYILHIGYRKQSTVKGNSFAFPTKRISSSIREKLTSLFKRIEGLPINKKHHFIALQEYGNFIDNIRRTVEEKKIDLVVMGTKGASGLKAAVMGSNTGDVITKVLCNVLAIPENTTISTPQKIAFPTDYNLFYTYPILETLTELLKISRANLQVVNIVQGTTSLTPVQATNKTYLKDYLEETFPLTHNFHCIRDRNVKSAIVNFAVDNHIEMLVMVAKNLNFFQQLLFDTSIEKLSFHTTVPLLVIHE